MDPLHIFRVLPACSDTISKYGQCIGQIMRVLFRSTAVSYPLYVFKRGETNTPQLIRSIGAQPLPHQSSKARHQDIEASKQPDLQLPPPFRGPCLFGEQNSPLPARLPVPRIRRG